MNENKDWREQKREERRRMREEWANRWHNGDEMMMNPYGRSSGVWTGVLILLLGVAALIKASVTDAPTWIFSWQMFLILLGLVLAIKHRFRGVAWFVLMLVGGASLLPQIAPELNLRRYIWPVALIAIGGFIILKRIRYSYSDAGNDEKKNPVTPDIEDAKVVNESSYSKEDFVHATSVFGGVKKIIISKNFKGGDLVNIFGGSELDLSRSDFTGTATIELTNIFGGTKLVVPPNWMVKSDAVVILGGVDDKRYITGDPASSGKTLLLKGTVIFGGVDIRSY